MTTRTQKQQSKLSRRFTTKTIDMIALWTALSWVAAMVGFSLRGGETSILVWLMRGMWGAVFIYATIFVALHTATIKEDSSDDKRSRARKPAETGATKADAAAQMTAELQAVDSGKLAEVVARNGTE